MRQRILWAAAIVPALLLAQAPGTIDAEGNLYWRNGTGRSPLKRKGVWRVRPLATTGRMMNASPAATAAEMKQMTATLDRLTELMKATPEGQSLTGYFMNDSRTLYDRYPSEQPPAVNMARLPLVYETRFFPLALQDVKKGDQYVPVFSGETVSIPFSFNRLPGALGKEIILKERFANEHEQPIYLQPRVTSNFQGFPIYEDQALMIAVSGRSPWAPVSYGRALKLAIPLLEKDVASAEARLAGYKKKQAETMSPAYEQQMRDHLEKYSGQFRTTDPKKWQGRLAGMERELQYNREQAAKEANPARDASGAWYWNPLAAHADAVKRLAALTASEAAQPACYLEAKGEAKQGRYELRGWIEVAGRAPGCEALVVDNYDYFDPQLARSHPQIFLLRDLNRCMKFDRGQMMRNYNWPANEVRHGCAFHPNYWEQLDWTVLAELVMVR